MKVLVIGATGRTGRHAVTQLLAGGHEITAFARDPSAVTRANDHLHVVEGDARDAESIDRAVQGQDAVLVAFGPRSLKKDDVQEVLMRNLIAAMTKHHVTRLVNLSAWDVEQHCSAVLQPDCAVLLPPGRVASRAGGQETRRSAAVRKRSAVRERVPGCTSRMLQPAAGSEGLDRRKRAEAIHAPRGSRGLHGRTAHRGHVGAEVCRYRLLTRFLEVRS